VTFADWVETFEQVMEEDRKMCDTLGKFARLIHPAELKTAPMKESFNKNSTFVLVTKIADGVRRRMFVEP
jgi:hypothetical protein